MAGVTMRTFVKLLPLLALLSGCAQQLLGASQKDCMAIGYEAESYQYRACVQERYSQRLAGFQASMANMSHSFQPPHETSIATAGFGTGYLKSDYISGANRICTYDRMGSAYVMTISAGSSCPISVD